jgi:hypothetical protein
MNGADAIALFLAMFILVIGSAVLYILWDNSCKKFDEVSHKIDNCLHPLDKRMRSVELFLENKIESDEDQALFDDIVQAREEYERCLSGLSECMERY